jgi:DNA-directed RNA polymerase beta subunit
MLEVPSYKLPATNVFNFRSLDWQEKIVENVSKMLEAGRKYGILVNSISIDYPEKVDVAELKRTTYKVLNIDLNYDGGEKTQQLHYDIPWLVNNHFYIGGNQKVTIYQLFDIPMICRKNIIKIRTNIQSFLLEKVSSKRHIYNYHLSIFGKKVAFAFIVVAFYGVEGVKQKFLLDDNYEYVGEMKLKSDYKLLLDDIVSVLRDDTLDKNRLLGQVFPRKNDPDIVDDLKLITEVDIYSKKFMYTDNVIDEFIYGINHNKADDCDYNNKRIRFSEQIIYCNLAKDFYSMINVLKKNKKSKFTNNSKSILQGINVSSITQFDFSINPLGELALLIRTSLSGPGGFEKQNVPSYLRDLHPSQLGLIDPADTADRDGCGTIQYLNPSVRIDENGKFYKGDHNNITSIAVSHVPFFEHDDATRLQMSSSQQRHSIMLKNFDTPMIQTGVEGMYTEHTSFLFKAERDGIVLHLDDDIIIVQYDNKSCSAFNIGYRKLYLGVADFYNVYYKNGESFKKGDIIAESNYLKNGRLTLGKNLLTAVMIYYGYNYEDGIIISDRLVNEDVFTSVHYTDLTFEIPVNKVLENLNSDPDDYKPLPNIFDKLKKGEIYAKLRTVWSEGFHDVIFEPTQEFTVDEDCVITDVKIYANDYDKNIPQYENFIRNFKDQQQNKRDQLVEKLSKYLPRDKVDNFMNTLQINHTEKSRNNYKVKGDSVEGVRVEVTAMYERKIQIGDKLGNRHGNKGVISAIIPLEKMPTLPDGRKADIILNPLGMISRMNIGQVFELHLAMSFNDLRTEIKNKYDNKCSKEEIYSYIMEYIKLIDNTDDKNYTDQMDKILKASDLDSFVSNLENFFLIQPPFKSIKAEHLRNAMSYTKTPYLYETFEPIQNANIKKKISWGYQYIVKMNHISQDKIASRGVGPYSAKTAQPLAGKSRKGGQRLGEMEFWALIGHGAELNLNEFITTKSDSIQSRNKYISEKMSSDEMLLDEEDDNVSQSLRLLQNCLKVFGVDYQLKEKDE